MLCVFWLDNFVEVPKKVLEVLVVWGPFLDARFQIWGFF